MTSLHDLLNANLHHVFNNRDADSRRRAVEETYTEDVRFTDPEGTVVGRDAVHEKAGELLDKTPDTFEFVTDGVHYAGTDTGTLAWAFGPAGEPVVRGLDIVTVRDGRIAAIRTLLAETPEA